LGDFRIDTQTLKLFFVAGIVIVWEVEVAD
jgi:hypothetical protein